MRKLLRVRWLGMPAYPCVIFLSCPLLFSAPLRGQGGWGGVKNARRIIITNGVLFFLRDGECFTKPQAIVERPRARATTRWWARDCHTATLRRSNISKLYSTDTNTTHMHKKHSMLTPRSTCEVSKRLHTHDTDPRARYRNASTHMTPIHVLGIETPPHT